MARQIKIANKIIVIICMLLLIVIGLIIFKSNNELDFNTITPNTSNINTNTTGNKLQENIVVDSNIIE